MNFHFPTSAAGDAVGRLRIDESIIYLGIAALALLLGVRLLTWALAPAGFLIRAIAGTAAAAIAVGSALLLVAAAALGIS